MTVHNHKVLNSANNLSEVGSVFFQSPVGSKPCHHLDFDALKTRAEESTQPGTSDLQNCEMINLHGVKT